MEEVAKKLERLSRFKQSYESETDELMREKYKNMIDKIEKELAQLQDKVEKQEDKVEKKEEKAVDDVADKIKKYKDMMDDTDDPDIKQIYKKKIDKLQSQISEVKEQIKEEKKELEEKKEEIKEAIKEVKEADKAVRTTAIKKADKATKDRKEISKLKKDRKRRIRGILEDLNRLVEDTPALRSKYEGKGGDLKRDAARGSKPFGYRFKGNSTKKPRPDQHGQPNVYYENRPDRADVNRSGRVKLEEGGVVENMMDSGFSLHQNDSYTLSGQPNPTIFGDYENMNKFRKWVEKTLTSRGAGMTKDKKTGMTHVEIEDSQFSIDNEYSMIFFEGSKESLEYMLNILIEEAGQRMDEGGELEMISIAKRKPKMAKGGYVVADMNYNIMGSFDTENEAKEYSLKLSKKDGEIYRFGTREKIERFAKEDGYMAKGGEPKVRKNSKKGWAWKPEAEGKVPKSALKKVPTLYLRTKYKEYVEKK